MVSRIRVLLMACIVWCAASCCSPALAGAAWPTDTPGDVLVAFGDTYMAPGGQACTHRGADIGSGAGAAALAPATGVVAFAGRVPGPHGGSVGAVTIGLSDGRRITVMPLDDVGVSAGAPVAEGDRLGRVAAAGDPSSDGPHLHVSLRAGELYLDPLALLGAPPANASAEAPESAGEAAGSAAPAAGATAASVAAAGVAAASGAAPVGVRPTQAPEVPAAAVPGAASAARATAADRAVQVPEVSAAARAVPVPPRVAGGASRSAASAPSALAAARSVAAAAGIPFACLAAALGVLALRRRDDLSDEISSPLDTAGVAVATAQVR